MKHNDHVIGLFALGPLQTRISDYAHAQVFAMTNLCWFYDVFEIMITMMLYLDF